MRTALNIRIDSKTKKEAGKAFKKMGLDVSSGVKLFLRQVINTQSIPFRIVTENGFTPEREQQMLEEIKYAKKHAKRYKDVKSFMRDLYK